MIRNVRTVRLAGTAILAALTVVTDYIIKFSGFYIPLPYPWVSFLKFNLQGVPIALSSWLFGLPSAATTSLVYFLAATLRSGNPVGASAKAIAEFSTIFGMAVGLLISKRYVKLTAISFGVTFRIIVMTAINFIIFPNVYGMPWPVVINLTPWVGLFNAIQGTITVILSYLIYEAYTRRVPSKYVIQIS